MKYFIVIIFISLMAGAAQARCGDITQDKYGVCWEICGQTRYRVEYPPEEEVKEKEPECWDELGWFGYNNCIPDSKWVIASMEINKILRGKYQGWEIVSVQYVIEDPNPCNNNLNVYYGTIFIGLKRKVCE